MAGTRKKKKDKVAAITMLAQTRAKFGKLLLLDSRSYKVGDGEKLVPEEDAEFLIRIGKAEEAEKGVELSEPGPLKEAKVKPAAGASLEDRVAELEAALKKAQGKRGRRRTNKEAATAPEETPDTGGE